MSQTAARKKYEENEQLLEVRLTVVLLTAAVAAVVTPVIPAAVKIMTTPNTVSITIVMTLDIHYRNIRVDVQ